MCVQSFDSFATRCSSLHSLVRHCPTYSSPESFTQLQPEQLLILHRNDVENLPIAMILATFAGSVSVFETQEYVHLAAYLIYAVSRTLWTFAYAYSAQPWRSIFFVIAITAEITIGINGLVAVFKDVPVPQ